MFNVRRVNTRAAIFGHQDKNCNFILQSSHNSSFYILNIKIIVQMTLILIFKHCFFNLVPHNGIQTDKQIFGLVGRLNPTEL